MPTNELKRTNIMKVKLGELKSVCEKYDIYKDEKKKRLNDNGRTGITTRTNTRAAKKEKKELPPEINIF